MSPGGDFPEPLPESRCLMLFSGGSQWRSAQDTRSQADTLRLECSWDSAFTPKHGGDLDVALPEGMQKTPGGVCRLLLPVPFCINSLVTKSSGAVQFSWKVPKSKPPFQQIPEQCDHWVCPPAPAPPAASPRTVTRLLFAWEPVCTARRGAAFQL